MHNFTFDINDTVYYKEWTAKVESRALDVHGKEVYLICLSNHAYKWVYLENLQRYIG